MESLVSGVQTDRGRTPPEQIWLGFFDNEDNGKIPGWEYIMGSRAFVNDLENLPQAAVIVDMIGDKDLTIYYEKNSDILLRQEIWRQAGDLGYGEQFIQTEEYAILDDHIPFLEAGIPAVELIDFVYPYWHTSADTIDKVSRKAYKQSAIH